MQNYNKEKVIQAFHEKWIVDSESDGTIILKTTDDYFTVAKGLKEISKDFSTAIESAFKAGRDSMREDAKGIFMTTHSNMGFLDKLEALK